MTVCINVLVFLPVLQQIFHSDFLHHRSSGSEFSCLVVGVDMLGEHLMQKYTNSVCIKWLQELNSKPWPSNWGFLSTWSVLKVDLRVGFMLWQYLSASEGSTFCLGKICPSSKTELQEGCVSKECKLFQKSILWVWIIMNPYLFTYRMKISFCCGWQWNRNPHYKHPAKHG